MRLTADFETTTQENDCRVWAYGICEIGNPNYFECGNNMDDFFNYLSLSNNPTVYFHNLKFDGEFILVELFKRGFKHVIDRGDLESRTFTTLISKQGQFYSMKIVFDKRGKKTKQVTIYDSLKILPFSVKAIAKGFDLPINKLSIDYKELREVGHILTDHETAYLRNDVDIVARALNVLFEQGLDKMTQGSNALFDYKRTVTKKKFDKWFPVPDYDKDIRKAYRGGYTYVSPRFKGLDVGEGLVFDNNSLYPSVMYYQPLPYGEGIFFNGEYVEDKLYNLYTQMLTCQFELKPEHIPTIQLKNNNKFVPTEYLTSSGDEEVTLCLTSVDLKLFFEHYDVYNIQYHSGWKFKSTTGLFTEYIDKWMKVKVESANSGNFAMYVLAKLMLNALYGKFALNPNVQSKTPYYDNGKIKYKDGAKEEREPIYIPVGAFVTAWARYKTITSAQLLYDRFMYADTDSLHLLGTEIPTTLDIHPTALGKWKLESRFRRARFLRQKSYIETTIVSDKKFNKMEVEEQEKCFMYDGERVVNEVTCAGLPESCHEFVTWENFHEGAIYSGKLQMKHVVGGIILKDIDFSLKGA